MECINKSKSVCSSPHLLAISHASPHSSSPFCRDLNISMKRLSEELAIEDARGEEQVQVIISLIKQRGQKV